MRYIRMSPDRSSKDCVLLTATVFSIQKFSVHDGPGIRTTVFLKGCPLSCRWCHNPGSQCRPPELLHDAEACTGCGTCVTTCPEGAVQLVGGLPLTDPDLCTLCGNCTLTCLPHARSILGGPMTVDEVEAEVLKDEVFYRHSGGGVTVSGGEPLLHIDFVEELLGRLSGRGVHTAVDTSGAVPFASLTRAARHCDVFLYDLKLVDEDRHREWTGVSSARILHNLRRLTEIHDGVVLRMPVVEGANAADADMADALAAIRGLPIRQVHLLPYHDIARHKYRKLGRDYHGHTMAAPTADKLERFRELFAAHGYDTYIGG